VQEKEETDKERRKMKNLIEDLMKTMKEKIELITKKTELMTTKMVFMKVQSLLMLVLFMEALI
jgi:hypothetical protein